MKRLLALLLALSLAVTAACAQLPLEPELPVSDPVDTDILEGPSNDPEPEPEPVPEPEPEPEPDAVGTDVPDSPSEPEEDPAGTDVPDGPSEPEEDPTGTDVPDGPSDPEEDPKPEIVDRPEPNPSEDIPVPDRQPEAAEPDPEEDPVVSDDPEPTPELPPEPVYDPTPPMADMRVICNGALVDTAVYAHDGIWYVTMESAANLLGLEVTRQEGNASFLWKETTVRLAAGMPNFFYGSSIRNLSGAVPLLCEEGLLVPVEGLCKGLRIGFLADPEQKTLYITEQAGYFDIPAGIRVPVLMYHCFGDEITGDEKLYVSVENMEAHLKYLTDNGYTPIFFHELAYADQIEKPILLTVDDGYLDNYTLLYPLLQKYNCKVTIFVVTGLIDKADHKMTSQQLRELSESGLVSIQSHTVTHPYLKKLSAQEQRQQMLRSKLDLARITGLEPYAFCYPYGEYNQDTLKLVTEYYHVAVRIGNVDYVTGRDRRWISRWYVQRATTMEEFMQMVEP